MQNFTFKLKTKSRKTALRTFPITLKKTKKRKKCPGNETQLALKQQWGNRAPTPMQLKINFVGGLHIWGSAPESTKLGLCSTAVFSTEKTICVMDSCSSNTCCLRVSSILV